MTNLEILQDYKKVLNETHPAVELDQRDELLLGMAINHACLILKNEKEKSIIKKENFTRTYVSNDKEPTKEEMDFVFSNLDLAEYETDIEHENADIYCKCPEEDLEDINVALYHLPIPFGIEWFAEERTLSIVLCKRCHQWACCD